MSLGLHWTLCRRAKLLYSCPILCNPLENRLPGSSVHGILQARIWSGLPFPSPVIKYEVSEVKSLSRVRLFATPWTVAYQAPPSMGFSRQEYLSGLPFPSPGDLPDPGIKPRSPAFQADTLTSEPPGKRCSTKLLRAPWTVRRSNQSILKEISPRCSLEGLML